MIHLSTCEALLMTKHKYAKLKQSLTICTQTNLKKNTGKPKLYRI